MNDDKESYWEYAAPPPPRPGSPVFGTREDWHLNACLNYMDPESQWSWYSDGYKTAGDILVEYVVANHIDQDILVFPIVFNYRQYLEVRLKELLMLTSYLLGENFELPAHHDLRSLWKVLNPRLSKEFIDEQHLAGVEHVIKEFAEVDPGSFSFRYPVGKDGVTPSLAGQTHINLGQVKDRISEVSGILDAAACGIREGRYQKQEYEAEMRSEAAYYEGEF